MLNWAFILRLKLSPQFLGFAIVMVSESLPRVLYRFVFYKKHGDAILYELTTFHSSPGSGALFALIASPSSLYRVMDECENFPPSW